MFLPAKIRHHQPAVCQRLPAMFVEALRTQLCWKAICGEAVDKKHIKSIGRFRHKLRTIFTNNAKSGAVLRNAKTLTYRDDMRIDFDNRQPGLWMMAVAPLGDGAAAKPDESRSRVAVA